MQTYRNVYHLIAPRVNDVTPRSNSVVRAPEFFAFAKFMTEKGTTIQKMAGYQLQFLILTGHRIGSLSNAVYGDFDQTDKVNLHPNLLLF